VLSLTHSPVAVGVLAAAQFLPFLLFGLLGGVAADRFDPRRLVLVAQTASMAVAATMAGVALAGETTVWAVDLLAFLRGCTLVVDGPARQSLTYQMVGRAELPNAVALNSSLFNASRVVGPALAGVLIAAWGPTVCFLVNTVSFLPVLGALALVRPADLRPLERRRRLPLVHELRQGFRYVRRNEEARTVLGMMAVISLLAINFGVLLPVLAGETLDAGPRTFGLLSACFGAGALAGALATANRGRASHRAVLVGAAGLGLAELVLAPLHSTAAAAVALVAVGAFFSTYTSSSNTLLQLNAPDRLRGRVVSLYYVAFNGTGPLGGLLVGWLAAVGGTGLAFSVAGGVSVLAAVWGAAALGHRLVLRPA
jgi:MFS family permease